MGSNGDVRVLVRGRHGAAVALARGKPSFTRYFSALDELARRIQLEALALTYLTGLTLAGAIGGVLLAYDLRPWFLSPFLFLLLEPIRGLWLYVVSRRY